MKLSTMVHSINVLKYIGAFSLPLTVYIAFTQQGYYSFLPIIYIFFCIPLVELLLKPNTANLNEADEKITKADIGYDIILYLILPIQFIFLFYFLQVIQVPDLATYETTGIVLSMGLMCGVFGINVAHELGHRRKPYEQFFAKLLLLSSLYMHFFIEHNRGHHKKVSTSDDPATSQYGETIYFFWLKSIAGSYVSAWRLEAARMKKYHHSRFSIHNEMIIYTLVQLIFLVAIYYFFGSKALTGFIGAAIIGILLLETVNYIEHYGLTRKKIAANRYERVLPAHSWNSNHIIGRLMLFELSRHSDHHFNTSRKYQILRYHPKSPQMPTGYPGMMLLALIPPLWFWVMHKEIRKLKDLKLINN